MYSSMSVCLDGHVCTIAQIPRNIHGLLMKKNLCVRMRGYYITPGSNHEMSAHRCTKIASTCAIDTGGSVPLTVRDSGSYLLKSFL